jgi:periplasmic protein CpxP/Spy
LRYLGFTQSTEELSMKSKPFLARGLAALAVAGSLAVASVPVFSQPEAGDNTVAQHERVRKHMSSRLDKMAVRLQITPAQQSAWMQYRSAVESQFGTSSARPAADTDAATFARWRAERASELARKLAVIADATATLQGTLNAEQRKTLSELTRREGRIAARHDGHGGNRHHQAM